MTPQQLIDTVNQLELASKEGVKAWREFSLLISKVRSAVRRSELELPLSQADVNQIIQMYAPLYNQVLTKIEAAGDALGTDSF